MQDHTLGRSPPATPDQPGRCRDDASFAMLAGTAAIPAFSGRTVRYRRNRSGDRQLNRALHTVVLGRLHRDERRMEMRWQLPAAIPVARAA